MLKEIVMSIDGMAYTIGGLLAAIFAYATHDIQRERRRRAKYRAAILRMLAD